MGLYSRLFKKNKEPIIENKETISNEYNMNPTVVTSGVGNSPIELLIEKVQLYKNELIN